MKQKYYLFVDAISFVSELSLLLLFLRIVGKLFGIGAILPVISWVYGVTNALLVPFASFIKNPVINDQYVLDITAVVALASYTLVYYLFSQVMTYFMKDREKPSVKGKVIDAEILSEPVAHHAPIPSV